MKSATIVLLSLTLAACATPQERMDRQVASATRACQSAGFKDGTVPMRDCVERQYRSNQRADADRSAAAAPILLGPAIVPATPPVRGPVMCRQMGSMATCF